MIYCEDCSSYECGCPERKEIESLRQQLAECQAALIEAHELIRLRRNVFVSETYNERCEKALAATGPKP